MSYAKNLRKFCTNSMSCNECSTDIDIYWKTPKTYEESIMTFCEKKFTNVSF